MAAIFKHEDGGFELVVTDGESGFVDVEAFNAGTGRRVVIPVPARGLHGALTKHLLGALHSTGPNDVRAWQHLYDAALKRAMEAEMEASDLRRDLASLRRVPGGVDEGGHWEEVPDNDLRPFPNGTRVRQEFTLSPPSSMTPVKRFEVWVPDVPAVPLPSGRHAVIEAEVRGAPVHKTAALVRTSGEGWRDIASGERCAPDGIVRVVRVLWAGIEDDA